jgi:TRAP-type C4-dicarboxylate transport system permease small subunit
VVAAGRIPCSIRQVSLLLDQQEAVATIGVRGDTLMKDIVKKLNEGYKLFCAYLLGLSAALLMAVILLREVAGISYDFLTDIVIWLLVWSVLLMAGPLYAEKGHVAVDLVLERVHGRLRQTIELFNAVCTLIFVAATAYAGVLMIQILYSQGAVFPRYISIPMWIVQISVPIGFTLFTLYAAADVYQTIRRLRI